VAADGTEVSVRKEPVRFAELTPGTVIRVGPVTMRLERLGPGANSRRPGSDDEVEFIRVALEGEHVTEDQVVESLFRQFRVFRSSGTLPSLAGIVVSSALLSAHVHSEIMAEVNRRVSAVPGQSPLVSAMRWARTRRRAVLGVGLVVLIALLAARVYTTIAAHYVARTEPPMTDLLARCAQCNAVGWLPDAQTVRVCPECGNGILALLGICAKCGRLQKVLPPLDLSNSAVVCETCRTRLSVPITRMQVQDGGSR